MRCSFNRLADPKDKFEDPHIPVKRLKCIKEHGHEGPHLDSSGKEWFSKVRRHKQCSHNILINDEHVVCELTSGHEGDHVSGEHSWMAKSEIRKSGECFYCNSKRRLLTIDHIVPRSKGGMEHSDNYVSCCCNCNQDKGSLKLEDYALKNFKRFVTCCKKLNISCSDFLKNHIKKKQEEEACQA